MVHCIAFYHYAAVFHCIVRHSTVMCQRNAQGNVIVLCVTA